jgi:hypothetical protein
VMPNVERCYYREYNCQCRCSLQQPDKTHRELLAAHTGQSSRFKILTV